MLISPVLIWMELKHNLLTSYRLYILEGIITLVWAVCCIFVVPKNYETAYFLNDAEKAIMRRRAERAEAYSGGSGHYGKADIKEAAKDIKSWLHGCIQIAVVTILYGFGTFLPIIIRDGFKYSTVQVNSTLLYSPHLVSMAWNDLTRGLGTISRYSS